MDIEKIRQLIFLAEEHNLNEIEVQLSWRKKIRIVRGQKIEHQPLYKPPVVDVQEKVEVPVKEETSENEYLEITAPIVGTFYRKPAPDAPPYLGVGDYVEKGKVVCIIEAMKIFNEIKSNVSGKVVKVMVEDGQPVEYGHTLFLIDPKG